MGRVPIIRLGGLDRAGNERGNLYPEGVASIGVARHFDIQGEAGTLSGCFARLVPWGGDQQAAHRQRFATVESA